MIAYLVGLALIPTAAVGVPWVCGRITARGDRHPQPPADYAGALAFERREHLARKTADRERITALEIENAALKLQLRQKEGVQ